LIGIGDWNLGNSLNFDYWRQQGANVGEKARLSVRYKRNEVKKRGEIDD
jgi:hypothetical protein